MVRRRLLAQQLLPSLSSAALHVRVAPPTQPLQLPSGSLLACLQVHGVRLPEWCTAIAIRDVTKTAVVVVPLVVGTVAAAASPHKKRPDDKQLLVVAERTQPAPASFAGLARVVFEAEPRSRSWQAKSRSPTSS